MAFLNYGLVYFNVAKNLSKTEILILSYINSNKSATTLTLEQWEILLSVDKRTISRSINSLTNKKLIINKSNPSKLVLYNKNERIIDKQEKEILNDYINKIMNK